MSFFTFDRTSSKADLLKCMGIIGIFASQILSFSNIQAQVTTVIAPSSGSFEQGNLGTVLNMPRTENENTIHDITGGARPGGGTNLFHSFDQFDVGETHVANFLNDTRSDTTNIVSRVTGGNPSQVFGAIQTEGFPDANLFLLNPDGVVFGPKASLNVEGAFYTSTADFIQLGASEKFYSNFDNQSVLAVDPPQAFGFLNDSPIVMAADIAAVTIEGLHVANAQPVFIVGKDESPGENLGNGVLITDGSLRNPSGSVKVVSVGAIESSEITQIIVDLDAMNIVGLDSEGRMVQSSESLGGKIALVRGGKLDVSGDKRGAVLIRGGRLTIDGADIRADVNGSLELTVDQQPEIAVEVETDSLIIKNQGSIRAGAFGSTHGGHVVLTAKNGLEVVSDSIVSTFAEGEGSAGDIRVHADTVLLSNSRLRSETDPFRPVQPSTASTGHAGNIVVTANTLDVVENSVITTPSFTGGEAGDISLDVIGGNVMISDSRIDTSTQGSGKGGHLQLITNNLDVSKQGSIQASTNNSGDAGGISVTLSGNLTIKEGSFIQVGSEGSGNAEDLTIAAKDIMITGISNAMAPETSDFTGATTTTSGSGMGGNLTIHAESLQVTNNGFVSSATQGEKRAGNVSINLTEDLVLNNGAQIFTNTDHDGNAGTIDVTARNIFVVGTKMDESSGFGITAIASANVGEMNGNGGDINLSVTRDIKIEDGGVIAAESRGTGQAGTVNIKAEKAILLDNAIITTEAEKALGGNINLIASTLISVKDSEVTSRVQQGAENAGSINIDPDFIVIQNSTVESTAVFGNGGPISLVANSAILVDAFSRLDASSQFGGNGTIDIQAPIQNLSGTLAPLPEETTPVTALYGARCAAGQGGNFSTFVDSKAESLSSTPGTFLSSPLLPPSAQAPITTHALNAHEGPVILTAFLTPLVLGQSSESTTACP